MGLSAWNAYRARQAAQQKALEQSKFLNDVVVYRQLSCQMQTVLVVGIHDKRKTYN